uniref:Uncharacterized protein n=1 Tax=Caenorhabditis japonica TaxID=281687 RepID=A0A8R1EPM5_CAEJA
MEDIALHLFPLYFFDEPCAENRTPCFIFLSLFSPLFALFIASVTCMFPFYLNTSRESHDKDKSSPAFLFVAHYHNVVQYSQCWFIVNLLSNALSYMHSHESLLILVITTGIFAVSCAAFITFIIAEQLLLSILAVHRFVLHFFLFKNNKKYLINTKLWLRLMLAVYLPIFIINLSVISFKCYIRATNFENYTQNVALAIIDGFAVVYLGMMIVDGLTFHFTTQFAYLRGHRNQVAA